MFQDVVVSAATGHQRGDGRGRCHIAEYFEDRNRKLAIQRKEVSNAGILQNVRVYIGGYLGGTTDIEMKRIIGLAGGTTLYVMQSIVCIHAPHLPKTDSKWGHTYLNIPAT